MNSKYFSSVVNKLLALKKQENIVPDEALRERLREGILARAAEMKQPRGVRFDAAGMKEFFYKFRYAFGAVPVALVAVLVAVQISQLPFDVSDGREAESSVMMVEEVSEKKIHTFSGANVLPADFYEKREKVQEGNQAEQEGEKLVQTTSNALSAPSDAAESAGEPALIQEGDAPGRISTTSTSTGGEEFIMDSGAAMPSVKPCSEQDEHYEDDEDDETQETRESEESQRNEQSRAPGCSP